MNSVTTGNKKTSYLPFSDAQRVQIITALIARKEHLEGITAACANTRFCDAWNRYLADTNAALELVMGA